MPDLMILNYDVNGKTHTYMVGDAKGPDPAGRREGDHGFQRSVISRIHMDDTHGDPRFTVFIARQGISVPWVRLGRGYRGIEDVSEQNGVPPARVGEGEVNP